MLTEEAHHLFVGENGIARILQRTSELMKKTASGFSGDVRRLGGLDLPLIQRHLNKWFSASVDLHGSEVSTNAATYFANGLKGRAKEDGLPEHRALHQTYQVQVLQDGDWVTRNVPLRNAMNEVLRDEYVHDNEKGVAYWNKTVEKAGLDFRFRLPHRRFNRSIGVYSGQRFDLDGQPIGEEQWNRDRKSVV